MALGIAWSAAGAVKLVPHDHPTIQAAIDACSSGDEVVVAAGVYSGAGNKNLDFGGRIIALRSATGPAACTIDCKGEGRAFVFHSGETSSALVEGFTIANGWATFNGFGGAQVGAAFILDSSPRFEHCIFVGNAAGDDFELGRGGAVCSLGGRPVFVACAFNGNSCNGLAGGCYVGDGGKAVFTACTFDANGAQAGAGLMCEGADPALASCVFSNNVAVSFGGGLYGASTAAGLSQCTFESNSAAGGGAVELFESGATVSACSFTGNEAGSGGGLRDYQSSSTISDCLFESNSADVRGGGAAVVEGGTTIASSIFDSNYASNGAGLHARDVDQAAVTLAITRCSFQGNVASASAGAVLLQKSSAALTNCKFVGNVAQFGGAIQSELSAPLVGNCTFMGNAAAGQGGAVRVAWTLPKQSLHMVNCIVWGNEPDQLAAGRPDYVMVEYSDVEGGWPGQWNIDADPLFVDPMGSGSGKGGGGAIDLHLLPGSPCIDAASNGLLPNADEHIDLDGNRRVINCTVDMGAFENQEANIPGDVNCDGLVNVPDLLEVIGAWGKCPSQLQQADPCPTDIAPSGGDGQTDWADLLKVVANWS